MLFLAPFAVVSILSSAAPALGGVDALWAAGDYRGAVVAAHGLLQNAPAADSSGLAVALGQYAEAVRRTGRLRDGQARAAAERALAIRERLADPVGVADAAAGLARVWLTAGDPAAARPLLDRALAIRLAATPDTSSAAVELLSELATTESQERRVDDARALHLTVWDWQSRHLPPDDPALARSRARLGNAYLNAGDYSAADSVLADALARGERSLPADHPELATVWLARGTLRFWQSRYDEAAESLHRAAEILERRLGGGLELASVWNVTGLVEKKQERWPEAIDALQRAVDLATEAAGEEHPNTLLFVNNLAGAYWAIGDFEGALRLVRGSLAIRERTLRPDHPEIALSLQNLAILLEATNRIDESRDAFRRALSILERELPPDHPDVLRLTTRFGAFLLDHGRLDEARPVLESALARLEATLGSEHVETIQARANLGALELAAGRCERAAELTEEALAGFSATLGPRSRTMAYAWLDVARAHACRGALDRAIECALRAEDIGREHLAGTVRILSARQTAGLDDLRTAGLAFAIECLEREERRTPDDVDRVWSEAMRSRAFPLEFEAALRRRGREATDPAGQARELRYRECQDAVSRARITLLRGEDPATARDLLARAEADVEEAERALATDVELPALIGDVSLQAIRAALPPRSGLVSWVVTRPGNGADRLDAFVLPDASAEPMFVPLGERESVDRLVDEWRAVVVAGGDVAAVRTAGEALRARVWDPIVAAWPGWTECTMVFIVPEAGLDAVPLGALPGDKDSWLLEAGPAFAPLVTERDLIRPPSVNASRGLIAFGDPDFGAGAGTGTAPGWIALPASAREVREIRDEWKHARQREPGDVVTGRRATESAFRARAPGNRVVHVATHGVSIGDNGVPLAGTRGIGGLTAGGEEGAASPSFSALVFAGANRPDGGGSSDDGVLTAEEIASLDFSDTDWVVLSACDSGLGPLRADAGVFALRRAFRIAGARTLVASLWSVEDESAREWMRVFYRAKWRDGLSTAAAARSASLEMLRTRRSSGESTSPISWAAFVATGDWR
ncbi:MAG: CHAT domain-containing tetratricopeptide repeat protein [bacterium]